MTRDFWVDVCTLEPQWDERVNQNLFTVSWTMNVLNFANLPLSQAATALLKGVIEYEKGAKVTLIVPTESVKSVE